MRASTLIRLSLAGALRSSPQKAKGIFDEISGTFINFDVATKDPPNLYASKTTKAQRFWASQNPGTQQICRFMCQQISWPAENFPNELLTNTVYGRLPSKSRK